MGISDENRTEEGAYLSSWIFQQQYMGEPPPPPKPCSISCASHVSHPCHKCGTIWGPGDARKLYLLSIQDDVPPCEGAVRCECSCHYEGAEVKHIVACCQDGWILPPTDSPREMGGRDE